MSSDIQIMSKRKQNQLFQLILKSRHKSINKMDLQREIQIAVTQERKQQLNNSLQTTRPLSNGEFLMSAEHLVWSMKVLIINTAADSEVGYDGANLTPLVGNIPSLLNFFYNMDNGFNN